MINCSIIGLPNVGKSTLFNKITRSHVPASNFPFCTIKPHHGIAFLNDSRLTTIADIYQSQTIAPAYIKVTDTAGLIKNAASGAGLGNQFLSHLQGSDVLLHVVRCFKDEKITSLSSATPYDDIYTIHGELITKDLHVIKSHLKSHIDQDTKKLLYHAQEWLMTSQLLYQLPSNTRNSLARFNLLTAKMTILVANTDYDSVTMSSFLQAARHFKMPHLVIEMQNKTIKVEKDFFSKLLNYTNQISYFTACRKKAMHMLVPRGTSIKQGAGYVHSDFLHQVIRASIVNFTSLSAHKDPHLCREKGAIKNVGLDYPIQDGDIVRFLLRK